MRLKRIAKSHQHLMHPGHWQLSKRYFVLEGAGFIHFKAIADAYIDKGASARPALKAWIKQEIIRGLRLDRIRISEAQQNFRASYLYISRSGDYKLFDQAGRRVLTTTDRHRWETHTHIQQMDLFGYFRCAEASLFEDRTGLMRHEALLEAPPIGTLDKTAQREAFERVCTTYAAYVHNHATPPEPELILSCYREVLGLLPEAEKSGLAAWQGQVAELAPRYRLAQAHLDFNLANVLVDDDLWLIDLDDAGLSLPAMYDVLNFALNEVYERRSPWLLADLRKPDFQGVLQEIMAAAILDGTRADFETAVIVNFVLRESSLVSSALLGEDGNEERKRARAQRNWALFKEILPGAKAGAET